MYLRERRYSSPIPYIGGALGVMGFILLGGEASHYWWIALLLDRTISVDLPWALTNGLKHLKR